MHVISAQKPSLSIPAYTRRLNSLPTIANMLLGHQRHYYIGDQQLRSKELDIIDLLSSMTLGHVLRARSSCMTLRPPSLLISIKGQMRVIRDKSTNQCWAAYWQGKIIQAKKLFTHNWFSLIDQPKINSPVSNL